MRRRMPLTDGRRRAAALPLAVASSLALTLATPAAAVADPAPSERGAFGERTAESRARAIALAGASSTSVGGRSIAPLHRGVPAFKGASLATTAGPDTIEVQPGDTVSAIAARHGLRTEDVLRLNGLEWSSIIRPGQVLQLVGATQPAASGSAQYTIRAGDTISAIARARGVGVQALLDANGLGWSSIIYPGQTLQIPGVAPAAPAKPADPPPAAPVEPATPPASAASHTVRSGDTVSAIAAAHGTSIQAVLDANGLGWSSIIYPGQVLALPGDAPAPAAAEPAPAAHGLDAEQADNARLIIRVGRELGVSDRGIAIALGTAMQESWIRNLDWGDRDSLGLFQQRPSTGWGTADEVRDRERSIRVFFGGPNDPNGSRTRGLLDIPGWESMSFAQAAQAVQISSYPDRYSRWEQPAYEWLAALG